MASWLSGTTQFWTEWGLRIAMLLSITAHVALVLLARTRRQYVSLWGTLFLWPAYQAASTAGTYALGKLSLGGGTTTSSPISCEHQLVAFWAPFLLLHLGRPDNISAYALEDNTLSLRQAVDVVLQVLGAMYVLYQYIYLGHNSGDLLPASLIMFAAGVAKYVERAVALWRGDLGNIRVSNKKQRRRSSKRVASLTVRRVLDDEQALLFAHNLFNFCRCAMVDDSSVLEDGEADSPATSERIFSLEWSSMCKVVEMELSLMYDILYTKATVIHTWVGYAIRLLSPLASATAFSLFCLFPKNCLMTPDIVITYILLVVAFMLDVVWLVRALGSSWAFAFLNARPGIWLHHVFLCNRWWHWLRCIVVSLDPCNLLLGQDARSYRKWSGKIGRYNLLVECTRARGGMVGLWSSILAKLGLEDSRYLFSLPPDVKSMLFNRIRRRLPTNDSPPDGELPEDPYNMINITTQWGQEAVKRRAHLFRPPLQPFSLHSANDEQQSLQKLDDEPPSFGREFQEDILVWHIGTCIFLSCTDQQLIRQGDGDKYTKAIEALSEYLMFLVAMRRHMLPGLVLRSLFEVTHEALGELWIQSDEKCYSSSSSRARREKLAKILRKKKSNDPDLYRGPGKEKRRLIADGAELAILLLEVGTSNMQELLELIFDVWVDKLLYAGTRCSRESHAKQLGRGGELTTIVWIMMEHAGPFRIGQFAEGTKILPALPPRPEDKKPHEKKKKESEEKKKKEWEGPPPPVPSRPQARRRRRFATLYPPY